MHTIIIAPTTRIADHELRYVALKEFRPSNYNWAYSAESQHIAGYKAVSAPNAYANLLGVNLKRIVIVKYLDWRFIEPGRMTNLWRVIQMNVARNGTELMWR